MVGWPRIGHIDDDRMAGALRGGEPDALSQLFRTYGERLFDYCHHLLQDEVEAALALHDAFVVARERASRFRGAGRFRAWLYLVTRNECQRRRAGGPASEPASSQSADKTLALVRSAQAGLDGVQRELLELSVRHEIDPDELAAILTVTEAHAVAQLDHAREDFERAYNAALIAAAGAGTCGGAAAVVDGWPLSPDASLRLLRHIEHCRVCASWPKLPVDLPRLLNAMPAADLPENLHSLVTRTVNGAADERRKLARRAGPWDEAGWPVPQSEPAADEGRRSGPSLALVGRCAAVAVLVVGVSAVILGVASSGGDPKAIAASPTPVFSSESPLSLSPSPSPSVSASPSPTDRIRRVVSTIVATTNAPAPPSTWRPTSAARPGTLRASGCTMTGGATSCTMVVTAVGGPVSWAVTGTSAGFSASGSGALAAGHSAGVTVRPARSVWCFGEMTGTVSFSPSASATVTWLC